MSHDRYESPFSNRYTEDLMSSNFSDQHKYTLWRALWFILANEERRLGAPITSAQVNEIRSKMGYINFEKAKSYENETHHDVMAHLKLLGDDCPKAKPILHLGVTSCFITDNTDILIMRRAMSIIDSKLKRLMNQLADFAKDYAGVETVAYTHFQKAQPTTVGKRACLWLNDFMSDAQELRYQRDNLRALGCKGATGNMSGTICLFDGDVQKARTLDENICKVMGVKPAPVTGQTYSRKQDFKVLQTLSGIAQSASKMATDIRLLAGLGELHEGFGEHQVGSSAMPYKKNPIECEKITSLSRYVITNLQNASITASTQWLERTLDDSANRRVLIPEMFMATNEILNCCSSVINGLTVDIEVIGKNLRDNMDKFLSEFDTVKAVKEGGDRQETHEKLRQAFAYNANIKHIPGLPPMRLSGSAEDDVKLFLQAYEQSR